MIDQPGDRVRATVVIEWENVQLAEQTRALEMLRRLSRQIDEVYAESPAAGTFEVILLYNDEECSIDEVRRATEPYFSTPKPHSRLRLQRAPGLNYYLQKNHGANAASGDIVVFLDSDVIPEDNWLTSLVSPFLDPNVKVVCGNTYLTATGPYSKAFALFWFFPLRAQKAVFEPKRIFFANNVAFRREIILSHPFIPVAGTTRSWCLALAQRLREAGITIYHNSEARVSHPAPFGLSHFVIRALAQGRDRVLMRRALNKGAFLRTFPNVLMLPFRAVWRILRHRRHVDLSLVELPAALGVAIVYNFLAITGYLLTLAAPGYAQRHWHI